MLLVRYMLCGEEERLELKRALDRIACQARSLGGQRPSASRSASQKLSFKTSQDLGKDPALPDMDQQDLGGIGLAIPPTSQPELPETGEADPVPPPPVPEACVQNGALDAKLRGCHVLILLRQDLDEDDLVLATDNLKWGQARLVSNETEMSIAAWLPSPC